MRKYGKFYWKPEPDAQKAKWPYTSAYNVTCYYLDYVLEMTLFNTQTNLISKELKYGALFKLIRETVP